MLTDNERKEMVNSVAARVLSNMHTMGDDSKLAYLVKLISMLDDTKLTMFNFAVEMTPNQPTPQNTAVDKLKAALDQQKKYERDSWPYDNDTQYPIMGESITYHLASLYSWSPEQVLALPDNERIDRLREIWQSFSIAGDIIKRYEEAVTELIYGPVNHVESNEQAEYDIQQLADQEHNQEG